MNMIKTHVFESAGLGRAPFRLVGHEHKIYRADPDAPAQVGGSCDFCSTGISDMFYIESADGQRFKVGSSCVNKTGDKGLINTVKREANRIKNERKRERENQRIQSAKITFESIRSSWEKIPHPYAWAAEKGLTQADWAEWMFNHAGNSGMMEVVKQIERG